MDNFSIITHAYVEASPDKAYYHICLRPLDCLFRRDGKESWESERPKTFFVQPKLKKSVEITDPKISDNVLVFWHPFESYYMVDLFDYERQFRRNIRVVKVTAPDLKIEDHLKVMKSAQMTGIFSGFSPDGKNISVSLYYHDSIIKRNMMERILNKLDDFIYGTENQLYVQFEGKEIRITYDGKFLWISNNEILYSFKGKTFIRNLETDNDKKLDVNEFDSVDLKSLQNDVILITVREALNIEEVKGTEGKTEIMYQHYYYYFKTSDRNIKSFELPDSIKGEIFEIEDDYLTLIESREGSIFKYKIDFDKEVTLIRELELGNKLDCIPSLDHSRTFYIQPLDWDKRIFTLQELDKKEFLFNDVFDFKIIDENLIVL